MSSSSSSTRTRGIYTPYILKQWLEGCQFRFEGENLDKVTKGQIADYSIDLDKDAADGFSVSADGKIITLATPVANTTHISI